MRWSEFRINLIDREIANNSICNLLESENSFAWVIFSEAPHRFYSTSSTPRRGLTKPSWASAGAFKKKSRDWQLWWIGQCWAQHNAALRKSNCEFSLQFTRVAVTIDSTKGCAGIFKWFALALRLPARQLECFTLRESVRKIYMSLSFIPADESPAMCIMRLFTLICNWPAAGVKSCTGKNFFTFGSNVTRENLGENRQLPDAQTEPCGWWAMDLQCSSREDVRELYSIWFRHQTSLHKSNNLLGISWNFPSLRKTTKTPRF